MIVKGCLDQKHEVGVHDYAKLTTDQLETYRNLFKGKFF